MYKAGKMNLLLLRIKVKRKVMYKKAEHLGFTHPSVVECSHELDILLNRVQGICS
ncbi:aspartyl-phosphate phosphatase Spo0E family protein [Sporosarcina aquimarina]|uniref:aspartyl-phosphate phosphatase Spo0E family protein n=1 Tax=Sporosarcina aquimarina TaxID=114975 RepID=UPI0020403477|nr:aspartyl-phosphate phosphatase Spo0E family protein [Sporosarcina aquimarina]MCM3758308.1 aspartyl-phosphate phosphatase Spo0E family protein [Sporosarcina aquimarina]